MTGRRREGSPRREEQPEVAASGRGVAVGGNNSGVVATGDYAIIVQQIQQHGGEALVTGLTELRRREIPLLGAVAEREPVGRAAITGQVTAQLRQGRSAQLYGPPGVGKKAIVRAVKRQLRAAGARGFELRAALGQQHTLGGIYEKLTALFFGVTTCDPPEEMIEAAAGELSAVIVIDECDLPADQIGRLLATFPCCMFLLTSQRPTLGGWGSVHEVGPLPASAALELLSREVGHHPAELRFQLEQACYLAGGRPQRLLLYAAFIRSAVGRPGHRPPTDLTGPEIAAILASGLSEPARRVLIALGTFGADLAPAHFAAVTGLPPAPATGPGLEAAGAELLQAHLVTLTDAGYRITADAMAALRASQWQPASPQTAARGLLWLLTSGVPAPRPDPYLLLAVARGLADTQPQFAVRFIRAASHAALAAGQVRVWAQLVALGIGQARAAGDRADLEYFLREERARALLQDDKVAIAAVLAALLELQESQARHQPPPAHPREARQPAHRQPVQGPGTHTLKAMSRLRNPTVSNLRGLAVLGTAAVVAAGVTVAVFALSGARQAVPGGGGPRGSAAITGPNLHGTAVPVRSCGSSQPGPGVVRLPAGLTLPPGAAVYDTGVTARPGAPVARYVIGSASQGCTVVGATNGVAMLVIGNKNAPPRVFTMLMPTATAPACSSQFSGNLLAGVLAFDSGAEPCLGKSMNLTDGEATAVLLHNAAGLSANMFWGPHMKGSWLFAPSGGDLPTYAVLAAIGRGGRAPATAPQGLSCTLPRGQLSVCTAALSYFLLQVGATTASSAQLTVAMSALHRFVDQHG